MIRIFSTRKRTVVVTAAVALACAIGAVVSCRLDSIVLRAVLGSRESHIRNWALEALRFWEPSRVVPELVRLSARGDQDARDWVEEVLKESAPWRGGFIRMRGQGRGRDVVLMEGVLHEAFEGYPFEIFRHRKRIGKIEVVRCYYDLLGAKILYETVPIEEGDTICECAPLSRQAWDERDLPFVRRALACGSLATTRAVLLRSLVGSLYCPASMREEVSRVAAEAKGKFEFRSGASTLISLSYPPCPPPDKASWEALYSAATEFLDFLDPRFGYRRRQSLLTTPRGRLGSSLPEEGAIAADTKATDERRNSSRSSRPASCSSLRERVKPLLP